MLALTLLVISRLSNTKIQSPLLANVTLLMWCVSLISINQYLFSEINFAHLNISLNVVLSAFFMVSIFLLNRASPLLVLATTHEKSVEDKLYYYAHDLITQLPNQQQALELFEHHLRLKATGDFIVLVCKPINFNDINTIIGHKNADLLLLQLAYCLQQKANLLPHLIKNN